MTDTMGTDGGPHWTVTNPGVPFTSTDALGQAVRGMTVTYTSDRGIAGTVFVPNTSYTPAGVRAAIAADIENRHGIADLTG